MTALSDQSSRAETYLKAGLEEKKQRAYLAAHKAFTAGIEALPDNSWATQYRLTLSLHEATAEAAFRSDLFKEQEKHSGLVLQHATALLDTIKTHSTICECYERRGRYLDAIKHALPLIQQLGVDFPLDPEPEADFKQGLKATNALLAGRTAASLAELPNMTDANTIAAMVLMAKIVSPVFMGLPGFAPLLTIKQVQTSLKYGNSPESILGYVNYGLILGNMSGDIEKGHAFGSLALSLVNKLQADHVKCYATMGVYATIKPWNIHVAETLEPFIQGYYDGIEIGDHLNASMCVLWYCSYAYFIGRELSDLESMVEDYSYAISGMNREAERDMNDVVRQAILNLLGQSESNTRFDGTAYQEAELLPRHREMGDQLALCTLHLHKMMLCCLFGQHEQAIDCSKITERHLAGVVGLLHVSLFYFYDSLARLPLFSAKDATGDPFYSVALQRKTRKIVEFNQRKIKKWCRQAPMNFQHKWDLVAAEVDHHINDDKLAAIDHYDNAIAGAKAHGYIQEEAMANELAALFYLHWGKTTIARAYMTQAHAAYSRWGAKAKVKHLQDQHPELLG